MNLESTGIYLAAMLGLVVCALIYRLYHLSSRNPLYFQFSSARGKFLVFLFAALFLSIAASLALWALTKSKESLRKEVGNSLATVLDTTYETIKLWTDNKKLLIQEVVKSNDVLDVIESNLGKNAYSLEMADKIRTALFSIEKPVLDNGFYVFDRKNKNIASSSNEKIGEVNEILTFYPEVLAGLEKGLSEFSPPIYSGLQNIDYKIEEFGYRQPAIFILTPIKNRKGDWIATLAVRFRTDGEYSDLFNLGRIGKTGETYAFNKEGVMISESRFRSDLEGARALKPVESSILNIHLRVPETNLGYHFSHPEAYKDLNLTLAASTAIERKRGMNVKGYKDYRGVLVVGAYLWDDSLRMGITTELDEAEAMAPYINTRWVVLVIVMTLGIIAVSFSYVTISIGSRANNELRSIRSELEARVKDRTKSLEDSETMLQFILNAIPAVVYLKDEEGKYILINDMYEEVVGATREDAIGKDDLDIMPGEIAIPLMKVDREIIRKNQAKKLEEVVPDPNGEERIYWTAKTPIETSNVKGLLGISIDITDRKQVEKNLKQALNDIEVQRYVLDDHAAVSVTDLKGNISYINQKFCKISGYSEHELVGFNHRKLSSMKHTKEFWDDMYTKISKGEIWHGEICNCSKFGKFYWLDATLSAYKDAEGNPIAYISVCTDITEIKENQDKLIEANYKIEEANRAKSEFLASMSHEIRTPMNGVIGMLGLLKKTPLSSDQSHKVEVADSSAKALLTVINDILDFSKVEAGKIELEEIEFDIVRLFEDTANALAFKADEKGIELISNLSAIKYRRVKGDPGRIRQIINNLAGNAIKFTDTGEVVVKARIEKQEQDELKLRCDVIDTGIGIPESKIATLFDSFTQADASTTRKYGGTGLGLAISKKLSNLMGGDVFVSSQLGMGSTFSFTLMLKESDMKIESVPKVDLANIRVLIVDDIETNRRIFREQLAHWGAQIEEAESGKDAVLLCERSKPFDIGLIDMHMPEMDGIDVCEALGKLDSCHNTKFLLMSSASDFTDLKVIKKAGFSGYFTKPVSTSDLFDAVSVVLAGEESEDQLITTNYLKSVERDELALSDINWPENTRILLVEDNQINQMVAEGILQELNLTCDFAGNGLEAIAALRRAPLKNPYTTVLMDCQMPEMDGYEASSQIRLGGAGEHNRQIPIIALTANAMQGDKDACIEAGMDDYISKPININQLADCLNYWLVVNEKSQAVEKVDPCQLNFKLADVTKEALVSNERLVSIPQGVDCFDIDEVSGKILIRNQFVEMLTVFRDKYESFVEQLCGFKDTNDFDQFRQLAEGVEYESRELGLQKFAYFISGINRQVRTNTWPPTNELLALNSVVTQLIHDIEIVISANS